MATRNWKELYDLETYLFSTVHDRFHRDGVLTAFDFFCIVVWKANRAKSKVAAQLLQRAESLDSAVEKLTVGLHEARSPKERLLLLIRDWGFRLPMASAVLSVLCPEDFTVYDTRVCEILGDFGNLADRTNLEHLWSGYEAFVSAVREAVPGELGLRDKDRFLWAKSFGEDLERDLARSFGVT